MPETNKSTEVLAPLLNRDAAVESAIAFSGAFQRWINCAGADGLTYGRLRLLGILHCQGPQMMRALADELDLTPRNMTAAIDVLEAEGLVRRKAHPTDRRATLIELTPPGVDAAERALSPRLAAIGELFDELSDTEQHRLAQLLGRLLVGLRSRRHHE
jgi:DNA-binding MarR family transcriptional regulator